MALTAAFRAGIATGLKAGATLRVPVLGFLIGSVVRHLGVLGHVHLPI